MHPKILIVEDERLIARDIRQRLEQLGYEVVGITDRAQVALDQVKQQSPDLVLMDIRLKGEVDGIVAAQQIREQFDCPVVFLTAHADAATLQQAQSAQPFGYLVKPIASPNLQAAIEVALTRHQTERSLRPATYLPYTYQVGGSLAPKAPSYVVRQSDHDLYQALIQGEFCYVFNTRQMGKSSLRVRTKYHLEQAGYRCASIDLTSIGSENVSPQQWYKGIAAELWRSFELLGKVNFKQQWQHYEELSPVQQLSRFIAEVLLVEIPGDLVIFIDEIDSVLSLDFPCDDFFALIRYCYNQRVDDLRYQRLTFALFGVATPSNLIQDRTRTPFNIGRAIELHGFQPSEVLPLLRGLEGAVSQPQTVLSEILSWTGGHPFLTQKLCQLMTQIARFAEISGLSPEPDGPTQPSELNAQTESAQRVEQIVRQYIISNWETQDEPEHLKTIRDRLLKNEHSAGCLLGLYQQILQQRTIPANDSRGQVELLLSGLVVKQDGQLMVRNRIYQEVFNCTWAEKQLTKLRPYAEALKYWLRSDLKDESRLLRGQSLKESLHWANGKNLSSLDYQFLSASEALDRKETQRILEAARTLEIEAQLVTECQQRATERRYAKVQQLLLAMMSVLSILMLFLSANLWQQKQQMAMSEIEAIAQTSEAFFALDQRLDALREAIKATRKLRALDQVPPALKIRVASVLRQAVYGSSHSVNESSSELSGVGSSPDSHKSEDIYGDHQVTLEDLNQASDLDQILTDGCRSIQDYLKTSSTVKEDDRHLCDGIVELDDRQGNESGNR